MALVWRGRGDARRAMDLIGCMRAARHAGRQLAEPILFGRIVDTLSRGEAAFPYIALWALFSGDAHRMRLLEQSLAHQVDV